MGAILTNKKAYFEFSILEEFICGIVLVGSEVKSIKNSEATISDSFIYFKNGEIWIKNFKVSKYKQSHALEKHEENRDKKLLLNRKEINEIEKYLKDRGITAVPLEAFYSKNKVKVKIAVVRGKKLFDKRQSIKEKDIKRDLERL